MQDVKNMLDFNIETPDDLELKRRYQEEQKREMLDDLYKNKSFSGGNKKYPLAKKQKKKKNKIQRKARATNRN